MEYRQLGYSGFKVPSGLARLRLVEQLTSFFPALSGTNSGATTDSPPTRAFGRVAAPFPRAFRSPGGSTCRNERSTNYARKPHNAISETSYSGPYAGSSRSTARGRNRTGGGARHRHAGGGTTRP